MYFRAEVNFYFFVQKVSKNKKEKKKEHAILIDGLKNQIRMSLTYMD